MPGMAGVARGLTVSGSSVVVPCWDNIGWFWLPPTLEVSLGYERVATGFWVAASG